MLQETNQVKEEMRTFDPIENITRLPVGKELAGAMIEVGKIITLLEQRAIDESVYKEIYWGKYQDALRMESAMHNEKNLYEKRFRETDEILKKRLEQLDQLKKDNEAATSKCNYLQKCLEYCREDFNELHNESQELHKTIRSLKRELKKKK